MKKLFLFIFVLSTIVSNAQETFNVNGAHHKNHNFFAFTNASIHVDYQTIIEKGTLLIQDGKIVAVAKNVNIPDNAVVYDLKEKHIYPSLIDVYSDYGLSKNKDGKSNAHNSKKEQRGAFGWNEAIKPEVESGKRFRVDEKQAA